MTHEEQNKLFDDNIGLVYYVISKKYPSRTRDEDFRQIGFMALWRAVLTYNESISKFATYAIKCITNEYGKECRAESMMKRRINNEAASYDTMFPDNYIGKSCPDVVFDIDLRKLLTEFQFKACMLRFHGYTQNEIADILGCTQTHISRTLAESMKKIKEHIVDI